MKRSIAQKEPCRFGAARESVKKECFHPGYYRSRTAKSGMEYKKETGGTYYEEKSIGGNAGSGYGILYGGMFEQRK